MTPHNTVDAERLRDEFRGDDARLIDCIAALIGMSDDGVLRPHGIGGHARSLLSAAAARLAARSNFTKEQDHGREMGAQADRGGDDRGVCGGDAGRSRSDLAARAEPQGKAERVEDAIDAWRFGLVSDEAIVAITIPPAPVAEHPEAVGDAETVREDAAPVVTLDDDARYRIARALCDDTAARTGNYGADLWKLHSDEFYDEADTVIEALTRGAE